MKLIHLSDLHIGKRVNEISMLEDQRHILQQILTVIREEKADAVLLCGDIYDKSVPSAEAVTVFDEFLSRLSGLAVPVFVISGNHDSPERLAFGSRLMEGAGIHLAPVYDGKVTPLQLSDEQGVVNFWLLPFLKPVHVKRYFPEETIESYTDALRVAIDAMHIDTAQRNVLLTHQFVTGAAVEPEGSEEISVGGSENVDASVFNSFDYVALGHIHGAQNIGTPRIRYCGTPLKYSFSESHHIKSVTVVELGEKGQLHLHTPALTPLHDMLTLRGSFQHLTDKAFFDTVNRQDYLQITLTDEEDVPEAIGKLRRIYPNLMKLNYDNTRTRTDQLVEDASDVEKKTPLQLFEELYALQNNQPMNRQQADFVRSLIEDIEEERL